MPRRRPPQPVTPDNLPDIPIGATKKEYYPAGNLVYYLQSPDSEEWRRGEISEDTISTSLHVIIDEATGYTFNVRSEYIRERQPDQPRDEDLFDNEAGSETIAGPSSSSASQEWSPGHTRTDSGGSDPLAWSPERIERETRTIDEVVDTQYEGETGVDELLATLEETHIGDDQAYPTAWSEWTLRKDANMEARYRMFRGEYEYEWREPKTSGKRKSKNKKK